MPELLQKLKSNRLAHTQTFTWSEMMARALQSAWIYPGPWALEALLVSSSRREKKQIKANSDHSSTHAANLLQLKQLLSMGLGNAIHR